MYEKEEIRKNPWKLFEIAIRHYFNSKVNYIEIELTNEDKNLFLFKDRFGKLKEGNNILKSFHYYDADGREYFLKLLPSFGKVWIFIGGEKIPRAFDSYEKFLDEITSY